MSSQGQRFRRRALRKGYKVDEVDAFLDRVEATLNGEAFGAPVAAQEVHDVVFRVRLGGYDEWQVDLHLDRVERQLAEMEERGGARRPDGRPVPVGERAGRPGGMPPGGMPPSGMPPGGMPPGAMPPPPERLAPPPDRFGPPDRMGPPDRFGPPERPGAPIPAGAPGGFGPPPQSGYGPPDPRLNPPDRFGPPERPGLPDRLGPPVRDDRVQPPPPLPTRPVSPMPAQTGYGRYDEPRFNEPTGPIGTGRYEPTDPGRHGWGDMTSEIRMPSEMGGGYGGPPEFGARPESGRGFVPTGDAARVDQLRRAFQPRRFGSGYDPGQVDRLFDGIVAAMSGRSPMPINDAELDPSQFNLVPGGYFEAEVDQALREVRDIIRRR